MHSWSWWSILAFVVKWSRRLDVHALWHKRIQRLRNLSVSHWRKMTETSESRGWRSLANTSRSAWVRPRRLLTTCIATKVDSRAILEIWVMKLVYVVLKSSLCSKTSVVEVSHTPRSPNFSLQKTVFVTSSQWAQFRISADPAWIFFQ